MNFKQISFKKAMKMVEQGQIKDLFFENGNSIVCAKDWRIDVVTLPQKKWFKRVGEAGEK